MAEAMTAVVEFQAGEWLLVEGLMTYWRREGAEAPPPTALERAL